jgi:hypothetical protein
MRLEPISKSFEEDDEASKLDKAEEIVGVVLAKCGLFVRDRETSVHTGLRGGGCSPHRGLHLKFPANREINREFCGNRPSAGILTPNRRANSMVCNQIPYATEQGIFKRVSGKIFQGTGNFHARCFDFEF